MPDLRPGAQKAMGFFGIVERAVREQVSQSELWDRLRAHSEQQGVPLAGINAADISQLRAIAGRMYTVSDNLAGMEPHQAITTDVIAEAPWARAPVEQVLNPEWQVRFEHNFLTDEGAMLTQWRTVIFQGGLPATAGDLLSMVEGEAMAMAEEYEVAHHSVGSVQILAV